MFSYNALPLCDTHNAEFDAYEYFHLSQVHQLLYKFISFFTLSSSA